MSLNLDKNKWTHVRLGDVALASKEKVDPAIGDVERYVAGEHMDTNDLQIRRWGAVDEVDLGPAFHRRFRPGQVLYGSRRTYLRKVAVAEFDGVCSNTTFVIESKDNEVLLQAFLPFVLSTEEFHAFAIGESKGSVNPYVNWSDIARYEFELPSPDEQKRMADLLWAVENGIRATSELMESVSSAKAIWFDEKLSTGGWKSEVIPKLVRSGPRNGKSATANDEGKGVPTLSISAIRAGRVLGGDSVKFIDVEPSTVAQFVIEDDDFLIVRGNGNKQLTGRGGLVKGNLPEGCIYPDLLIRLQFDESVILPRFAAEQWNSRYVYGKLIRKAKSTNGIWKINGQDIKSHSLFVPSLDEQVALIEKLDGFDAASNSCVADLQSLRTLGASLLDEISGDN